MKYYLPACLWSLLIAGLSVGPGLSVPPTWEDLLAWDKLGHFGCYAIHVFLICRAFFQTGRKMAGWPVAISFLFGFLLEGIQYLFFPGRFFETLDLLANGLGGLAGFGAFKFFYT